MTTASTIPVTVKPEAATWIDELGMRAELEQMIEKAKEVVPYLRTLRVTLEEDPEGDVGPGIVIWAHRDDTDWENDRSDWDFGSWMGATFPPAVCIEITLITVYNPESDYEG